MHDFKLIVEVIRVRREGCEIPRYQIALASHPNGVLTIYQNHVPWLNRHVLVAQLIHPETGRLIDGVAPLYDASILRATGSEWILTGFERITNQSMMKEFDYAQTWIVSALSLETRA